ncbi:MAG: FkbM family methyltransferase [Candidatus Omnitrophica bacterium]|nr:FkbM family methyltransferase [Candidatus Omnitrophota bacterium]
MRRILRNKLSKNQWNRLKGLKRKWLSFVDRMNNAFVNVLPSSFRVYLKSRIRVVKKMDYGKADIFLDLSSSIEKDVRLHSCVKEPETIEWIETFIKPGDVLFDIGANVGAYSLVTSKHLKDDVQVYAFEPSFLNFPQLCKNIHLNKCGEAIIPLNIALAGRTTVDYFYYQNLIPGGALHNLGEAIDYKHETFDAAFKQTVLSYAMDDLIESFDLPVPNHIKLDVDGIEKEILDGAQKTLLNPALKSVLVEAGDDKDDIVKCLIENGFRIHSQHQCGPEELKMFNYVFTRF